MPETAREKIHRLEMELKSAQTQLQKERYDAFLKEIEEKYCGRCFLLKYMVNGNGQSYAAIQFGSKVKSRSRPEEAELSAEVEAKHVHVYCVPEGGKGTEWWGPKVERCDKRHDFKEHQLDHVTLGVVREIEKKEFKRIWKMVDYVTRTFLDRMLNPPPEKPGLHPDHISMEEPDPEFTALPS